MEQEDMVLSNRQMSRKNRAHKQKAFLWRITNAPACCAFSLTVLAALPVLVLAVFPAVTGALGGGVFLFDGLFLLPA